MELRLFSEGPMLGGSVVFDSSRIVCSTKKSFIKDALSASSVWTSRLYKVEELMWYYLV